MVVYLFTYTMLANVISSIYVSRKGTDHLVCGNSTSTCGTLYHASSLLDETNDQIYVLDGQNEIILQNYINIVPPAHPCLPQTFNRDITITFDESIQNMLDWYPLICTNYDKNQSTSNNITHYMFTAIESHLTFNNLQIDLFNYTNVNFGLIDISTPTLNPVDVGATLTCNNCKFTNILYTNNKINMISVANNIKFDNVIFNNIYSVNDVIKMGWVNLDINNLNVSNCFFDKSFIYIANHYWAANHQNNIKLVNSVFSNIYSQIGLFNEQFVSTDLTISNVYFMDINGGYIYHGQYEFSSNVIMEHIQISTSQLFDDRIDTNKQFLFHFNFADEIHIENITVQYKYNITKNVEIVQVYNDHPLIHNGSYVFLQCHNPIPLIPNYVSMSINNAILSIDIAAYETQLFKIRQLYSQYDYITFGYLQHSTYAIILNHGELYIKGMSINGLSVGRRIFQNFHLLNIDDFKIIVHSNYTPNDLQSRGIVRQTSPSAKVTISNSMFIGTVYPIYIQGGSATIYESTFQDSSGVFFARAPQNVLISGCNVQRVGRYYGNLYIADKDANDGGRSIQMIYIEEGATVVIENNSFSGFDDYSQSFFVFLGWLDTITIRNNVFTVDMSDLLYEPVKIDRLYGLLRIQENTKVSIYGNNFYKNDFNPQTAWIFLQQNYEPTCLSANNFTNQALMLYYTDTTSCFRESLIECISNDCQHGEYGDLNKELFNKMSYFNIDIDAGISSIYQIFGDSYSYNALDNIQINVFKNGVQIANEKWSWLLYKSSTLIMDSILPPNVEIIHPSNCSNSVLHNDRLASDNSHVAKLLIICDYWWEDNLTNLSFVNSVDHLSATQIYFNATHMHYYPGQKLTFDYQIYDKLGNDIHEDNYTFNHLWFNGSAYYSDNFAVILKNELLDLSQVVNIEHNGECSTCEHGIVISGIDLKNNQTFHLIETDLINNDLILMDENIVINMTWCPVSYGADGSNYHCQICPAGTYNLLQNNKDICKDCNEQNNEGLKCYEGGIAVKKDYWIGFTDEKNYNGISADKCPVWYCCNTEDDDECNYENKTSLCAENRNPMVPLCGACKPGYSQAMNSTKCVKCNGDSTKWYLVLPCVLSIVFTLYLIKCHPKKKEKRDEFAEDIIETGCCVCSETYGKSKQFFGNEYFSLLSKTLILRILIYYEQALSSILFPSSIASYSPYMYSIASLFNLEIYIPDNNNSNIQSLWCFYDGLTSKEKILAGLIPSVMTICLLLFMFVFIKLGNCLKCQLTCESINACNKNKNNRSSPHVYRCCNTNYGKAFLALWIICVGQLLSVSFKILNCQSIQNNTKYVHFYFGEQECSLLSWTVILSICFIIIVFIVFGIMLIILKRSDEIKRQDENFALNTLCKYYKSDCYYWEFIILTRRVLITMFAILYRWEWYPIILITVLLICIGLHYEFQPFKTKQANIIEYMSLSFTIIVICIQITSMYNISSNNTFNNYATPILTLFIIVPIFCVFLYLLSILIKINQNPKNDQYSFDSELNKYASTMVHISSPPANINDLKSPIYCKPIPAHIIDDDDDDDDGYTDETKQIEMIQHKNILKKNMSERDLSVSIDEPPKTPQFTMSRSKSNNNVENNNFALTIPLCDKQPSVSTHL